MNIGPPQTVMLEEVTAAQLLELVTGWEERGQRPAEITLLTTTDEGFWTFRGDGIDSLVHALEAVAYTQDAPEPAAQGDSLTAEQRAVLVVLDLLGVNRLTVMGDICLQMSVKTLLETMTRHLTWAVTNRPATTRLSLLQAYVGEKVAVTTAMAARLNTSQRGRLEVEGLAADGRFRVVDAAKPEVVYAQFAASDVRQWAEEGGGLLLYLPRVLVWDQAA